MKPEDEEIYKKALAALGKKQSVSDSDTPASMISNPSKYPPATPKQANETKFKRLFK